MKNKQQTPETESTSTSADTGTLSYDEAVNLFKKIAKKAATDRAVGYYEELKGYTLDFYGDRVAWQSLCEELPRDLFDACGIDGICDFLFNNKDLDLDEVGSQDSGLTAAQITEEANNWTDFELEDLEWVKDLASDED